MKLSLGTMTIAAALLMFGCAEISAVRAQRNAVEGSFQRTLNVSGVLDLDVSTGSGSIEVREGGAGRVQIMGTIRVGERDRGRSRAEVMVRDLESNPPIEQTGATLRVGHLTDPEYRRNVTISYDIIVPRNTKVRSRTGSGSMTINGVDGPVDAETGSGSIDLLDINGNVNVRTGSGSIEARTTRGEFIASTGSGRISASLIGPGNVDVTTGSGSIEVTGVKGALHANSGSGRIVVDGEPTGRWDVSTGSGSVSVRLPAQAAFDLRAHTGSGGITVDHPVAVQGRIGRRNEINGKVRGGGVTVDVRTSSGSIHIE